MANKRIEMLDIKHLLRLKKQGYKNRRIGRLLDIHRNTINAYVRLFRDSGKSYEELLGLPESELLRMISPPKKEPSDIRYAALSALFGRLEKTCKKRAPLTSRCGRTTGGSIPQVIAVPSSSSM